MWGRAGLSPSEGDSAHRARPLPAHAPSDVRGRLERAIEQVSDQVPFEIAEHDVVLRGLCERCAN
jgi:hypothetical protein